MFCPRCGQEQISEDTRFCSRCGFLLELVSQVLTNGGVLPQLAELNKEKKLLTRKNGLKLAAIWVVVMWFVITPILGIARAEPLTAVTAVLGFAGGVLLLLISFLFLKSEPQPSGFDSAKFKGDSAANDLSGNLKQNALPPQQSVPTSAYIPPAGKWHETNDLVTPSSVTEGTTKLLQKDE